MSTWPKQAPLPGLYWVGMAPGVLCQSLGKLVLGDSGCWGTLVVAKGWLGGWKESSSTGPPPHPRPPPSLAPSQHPSATIMPSKKNRTPSPGRPRHLSWALRILSWSHSHSFCALGKGWCTEAGGAAWGRPGSFWEVTGAFWMQTLQQPELQG